MKSCAHFQALGTTLSSQHRCFALHRAQQMSTRQHRRPSIFRCLPQICRAGPDSQLETQQNDELQLGASSSKAQQPQKIDKEVSKFARNAATTFAPRASGASKNPAYKGSLLYTIFEVQAYVCLVIGGLLSFNIIFPSEQPSIARLIGMWSIWMFTVPALRARDCSAAEKEVLNYLFLLIPVMNVTLPFVWKSFPFIYSADVAAMAALYAWKVGLPKAEEV